MLSISCGIKGQELPLNSIRFGKNKGFVGSLEDTIIKGLHKFFFPFLKCLKKPIPPSLN